MAESTRPAIVRRLGSGGTADVYLAELGTGERVALKRMRGLEPDARLRLKREFRAVEHLAHPNLVRLFELHEDAAGPYFTMELVDGVDVVRYCRGGPRLPRLATVLPQLLDALAYLHANGVVHGDVSATNVLVRHDGTVKLLDFGLHSLVHDSDAHARAAGTPAYIAPERLRHEPPTSASDLYSLGCLLFHVLADRPPFEGPLAQVLDAHLHEPPAELCALVPELPPRLANACRALLAKRPDERPTLHAVKADLLEPLGARGLPSVGPSDPPLVGRAPLQAELAGSLARLERGDGLVLALYGPSGIGKSALAGWLADVAERRGIMVLRGRARPSERLAFNAMDGIVDALARRLGAGPRDDNTRRAATIAAATFPVLAEEVSHARAREHARAVVRARLFGEAPAVPRPPDRRTMFEAVATLAGVAAGDGQGLIVIDDAQWADSDAVALLDHVVTANRGRIGAVLVVRSELEGGTAARWLAQQRDLARVEVPPLTVGAIGALLRAHGAAAATESQLARTAAACAGLPVLAIVAGPHLDRDDPLGAAVRDLVAGAGGAAREVLALLAAADRPLSVRDLAGVAALDEPGVLAAIDQLVRCSLVRRLSTGELELFHETVRVRVEHAMHPDWLAHAHERLASRQQATRDAEQVRHLLGAGLGDDAARVARTAAESAAARYAYGQASDLYAFALSRAGGDDAVLLRARAEALEGCARFAEAAECWRRLARRVAPVDRAEVMLRQACARLGARQLGAGLEELDRALAQLGAPGLRRSRVAALRAGARFLVGPRARPRPPRGEVRETRHAEQLVRVGELVGYFDTLTGIAVLQRAQREFERADASEGAAWCDYLFSLFARFGDARRFAGLAERYRAAAEARLQGRAASSPIVRAFPAFLDGYAHLRAGRWHAAVAQLDRALAITSDAGRSATFEHRLASSLRTSAVLMMQDARAAEAAVTRFAAIADDSSDSVMQCHVANARTVQLVLQGRLEVAADVAHTLVREWPSQPSTVQLVLARAYAAFPDLYRQRAADARRELTRPLALARRARLFPTAYGPILATWAALAEALALREGDRRASPRRVEAWARVCAGRPSLQTAGALRARAYAADAVGDTERAVELLVAAEREARRWEQPVGAAIAAYQRGRRIGGTAGAEAMAAARAGLAACGASARLLDEDAAPPGRS